MKYLVAIFLYIMAIAIYHIVEIEYKHQQRMDERRVEDSLYFRGVLDRGDSLAVKIRALENEIRMKIENHQDPKTLVAESSPCSP